MKIVLLVTTLSLLGGFMYDPFSTEAGDAFSEKMSHYFKVPTKFSFRDLPGTWWSATLASGGVCTNTVYLSPRWKTSTSPLWKYTLVHEWVHVSQRGRCSQAGIERETRLEAMSILIKAKEWGALIASANHFIRLGNLTMKEVTDIIKEEYYIKERSRKYGYRYQSL
ncbi:MAG: hypothetical protein ACW99G_07930 [Candidatus Thorarchaeota archaeon]|jgi:hypothetical protein